METFSALPALCAGNSPVPVSSPHKGQWRGALMSSLICAWINDWVNNREAGDLRRHRGHYDVNVMSVEMPVITATVTSHWMSLLARQIYVDFCARSRSLWWRHNGCDSVSNHQPRDCLLNRLFRRRSKKTSKLRVTGLCVGNSPGTGEFPAQMASNAENVSIWWRHHVSRAGASNDIPHYLWDVITCPCLWSLPLAQHSSNMCNAYLIYHFTDCCVQLDTKGQYNI